LLFEFRTNDQELAVEIDQSKLQRAEADLRMAELTLTNKRDLRAKKIISETETLQAEASRDIAAANVVEARLIPNPIDQNPWAHFRSPMDMMRQG
jgi:hypothetical protein